MGKKKIITGITMGEPAGISSEITLKVWKNYRKKRSPFGWEENKNY